MSRDQVFCPVCMNKHKPMESSICEKCYPKVAKVFEQHMTEQEADRVAYLLGTMDLNLRDAWTEIVKLQTQIEQLALDFKHHDHKAGTLVKKL